MSTGDIDNVLGPTDLLEKLRSENSDLADYFEVAWQLAPCRTFFIPYGAGIDEKGIRPYISYDIQAIVAGIDCSPALVRHETAEWGLRYFLGIGEDYLTDPRGHRLANRAEYELVANLLKTVRSDPDEAWELYSEVIDPQIIIDERTDLKIKPIPQDLALYPYDEEMQSKLVEAMSNARSIEEWDMLTDNSGTRSNTLRRV